MQKKNAKGGGKNVGMARRSIPLLVRMVIVIKKSNNMFRQQAYCLTFFKWVLYNMIKKRKIWNILMLLIIS